MTKTHGQIGFEAYGDTAGWRTFDGRQMPTWDELSATENGRETQRRWEVAAVAIRDANVDPLPELHLYRSPNTI